MTPEPTDRPGSARVLVQKFGGTSVSTVERRELVIGHVRRAREEGYRVAIVVSAMGRQGDPYATDTLLDLLRSDGGPVDRRDYDMIFACGEIISAAVMSHLLKRAGIPAVGLTAAQVRVLTDGYFSRAQIKEVETSRLRSLLNEGTVPVVTGGQGVVPDHGDYTTLGRGGSDTSGVALGVYLDATKTEIFTDVEGVATADPRMVANPRILDQISYESMLELARYGAKVVHQRAVRMAHGAGMTVVVRSTFSDAPGTVIGPVADERPIVGITTWGPTVTWAVEDGLARPDVREAWEQRREVLTMAPEDGGDLVLGALQANREELERIADETGATRTAVYPEHFWVTVVGAPEALSQRFDGDQGLLSQAGIKVVCSERAGRHNTYVVPAGSERRAVEILHDDVFRA